MQSRETILLVSCLVVAITSWSPNARAAKSGVSPGVISLPKGPGSVSGLGESFKPDLNTGSMTYRVPIKVPSGVGGLTPSVALSYSSGGGNSEVGFGWSLGVPKIQIRTEKGIPQYDGSDIYTISGVGSGELVPLASGFYRLEVEGAYIRAHQGQAGWEVRDKSGKIYRFGQSAESRTEDNGRVFAWYLTDQYDTLGNHIEYVYEHHGGQPYLRWIRYNNFSPDVVAEVELTYEARDDALASYRSGFKVTQGQRLSRIESSVGGQLLARYTLDYAVTAAAGATGVLSRLAKVTMVGTDGETGLPSLTLGYYAFDPDASQVVTMSTPPGVSPGAADNALADLNGDSFPDLLVTSAGNFEYYLNDGGTGWLTRDGLPLSPSVALSSNGIQLADVDGDGRIDLLAKLGPGAGDFRYYPADDAVGFGNSVALTNNPDFSFEDPEVRLFDVTGDGRADVVRTTVGELLVYENLGGGSYADGQVLPEIDANMQVMFSDTAHVRLADMNGDGLIDVACLRSDSVLYWPQMGGGRFDAAVNMGNAPTLPDMTWVRLRDLNGDGLGDLVRVGVNQVDYWLNQGDGTYGAMQTIVDTPYRDPINTTVDFADMNGNGSTDIVWIDVSGSPDQAWQYLDIMGASRPGLLHEAANGLGLVLRAEYSSSGAMSAQARRDGDPWSIEQPVPTQVLSRLTVSDSLGPYMVTELEYRDGHYNGEDREFRGFGEAAQREVGDEHTPTLLTTVEFDVGWVEKARKGIVIHRQIEDEAGKIFRIEDALYNVIILATGTDGRDIRATRQSWNEVTHVEGTTTPRVVRTEFEWDEWGNETAKYEWGEVVAGDPAGGNDERITVSEYAVNTEDWILDRVASKQLQNALGETIRWQRLYYDGAEYEGLPQGHVARGLLKREEVWLGPDEDRWIQKRRLAHDEYGNVLGMRDARGYDRELTYDEETHRFPVEERLKLDERDIVMRASYDTLRGTLVRYEDPNGQAITYRYDPLCRVEAIVHPGDSASLPTISYEYILGNPTSAVWTRRRVRSGEAETLDEVSYYDGRARLRSRRQLAEAQAAEAWIESTAKVYDVRGKSALTYRSRFVSTGEYGPPDPTAERIEVFRDGLGRMIRKILPDGSENHAEHVPLGTWSYDENDADPSSPHFDTPTYKAVDGLGRTVLREEEASGGERHARHYTWNVADSLLAFEDAEGHVRSWRYDGLGRRIATEDPDGGSWRYHFDDNSNEVARIDPLGGVLSRAFDGGGRILWEAHTDAQGTERRMATYHYDVPWTGSNDLGNAMGRLGWVEDAAGVYALGYDERGRATSEIRQVDGRSYRLDRTFDAANRLMTLTYPDGALIRYSYNARSLVQQVGGVVLSQRYGAMGELVEREFGNGVTVHRTYDARLRLTSLVSEGPGSDGVVPKLQDFAYTYDRSGNVTKIEDRRAGIANDPARDQRVSASYDALDRLVYAEGNGYSLTWTISPSGNVLSVEGEMSPAVPKLILGSFSYGGTGAGPHALTQVETGGVGGHAAGETLRFDYDAAGNLRDTSSATLSYDGRQQVERILSSSGNEVHNVYDFQGKRVQSTVQYADGRVESTVYGGANWEVRDGRLIKYVVIGSERVARIGDPGGRVADAASTSPSGGSPIVSGCSALVKGTTLAHQLAVVALLLVFLLSFKRRQLHLRASAPRTLRLARPFGVPVRAWVSLGACLLVIWSCKTGDRTPSEIDNFPANAVAILTDHLGSWHLLVDAHGQVVAEQAFLAYGIQRYRSGGSTADYGYTGKLTESDTGLIAIGVRHLISGVGRWNRPDPAFLHDPTKIGKGVNPGAPQQYSLSNPLTLFDPDGHFPYAKNVKALTDALNKNRPGIVKQLGWGMRHTGSRNCGNDALQYLQSQIGSKAAGNAPWRAKMRGVSRWTKKFNIMSGRHPATNAPLGKFAPGAKDRITKVGKKWFLQVLDASGSPVSGLKIELKMFMVLKMAEGQNPNGTFTNIHHIVWLGGPKGLIHCNQHSKPRSYKKMRVYGSGVFGKVVGAYELPAHQSNASTTSRSSP